MVAGRLCICRHGSRAARGSLFRAHGGKVVQTFAQLFQGFRNHFGGRADADPEVIRAVKETAWNHGGIEPDAKQFIELVGLSAS